jgi:hypothetical protein
VRAFKGIICADVSEFESYMPSQPASPVSVVPLRNFEALKSGNQGRVQCDSHGTFDTRGTVRTRRRGQLSGLTDRRPIERLVNKGVVERHTLNSQQEEYVLTAIGKKVLDNK